MLTANGLIRGPLRDFWFSTRPLDYFPLTYTSLWLEWRIWGMNPMGYHITNVILHALSCVILWRAFVRLKFPAAWLAALLFAIHPVNVESVAWIAERKNVLAMFFYSITVWSFVRFLQFRERRFYIVSLVAFLLSLLAKPAAAPWPLVALGIAYCSKLAASEVTKLKVRVRLKKYSLWAAPLFGTATLLSFVTVAFQYGNAIVADDRVRFQSDLVTRLERAGSNIWFYLSKAAIPYPLMFAYPKWHMPGSIVGALLPDIVLIGLIAVLVKYRRTWGKPGLVALAYYVLLLTPVLGFFNIYFQRYSYVADHWQYFALPAITVLIAFYLHRANLHYSVGVALLLTFACLTFGRCRTYQSNESVWQDTLGKNPNCTLAMNELGLSREQAGHLEEATKYYRHSIEVEPNDPLTRVNLGYSLVLMGEVDKGIEQLRDTIRAVPSSAYAYYDLGLVLRQQGKTDEAIAEFREAIQRNPRFTPPYNELANALWIAGKRDEAIAQLDHALNVDPNDIGALINLGTFLSQKGEPKKGRPLLEKAISLQPENADARARLANILLSLNQTNAAQEQFTIALGFDPSSENALYGMGNCLRISGQTNEAAAAYEKVLAKNPQNAECHFHLAMIRSANNQKQLALEHFRAAVRLKPNWVEAANNLAWFLATDPKSSAADCAQSVRLAEHAVQLSAGRNPVTLDTLGVAWARNEVFARAIEAADKGAQLAVSMKLTNLSTEIQTRIDLYNQKKPYIEP